jgi:hypothetical protein
LSLIRLKFLLLLFVLLLAGSAQAAIRYATISATGCSNPDTDYNPTTNTCGSGSATVYTGVTSIQSAYNASSGGDTVRVRASGTKYLGTGHPEMSGGATTHINMEIRPNVNVIGNPGAGTPLSLSTAVIVEGCPASACGTLENPTLGPIYGFRSVYLRNLTIRGDAGGRSAPGTGTFNQICIGAGSLSRIENVTMSHCGDQGTSGVDISEYINVTMHDIGYNGAGGAHSGPPFACYSYYNPAYNDGQCHGIYSSQIYVDGGEFYDNSGYGIHCVTNCGPTIIKNIKAYNNENGGIIVQGGTGNTEVFNNLSYSNAVVGIFSPFAVNGSFYNNTIANNGDVGLAFQGGVGTVRNNLIIGNSGGVCTGDGGACVASGNITTGTAAAHFVNAAGNDYHLISSSTARDVHACTFDPSTDKDGTVRPQGALCDAGAYEFTTGTPQPTAPVVTITTPTSAANTSTASATTALGGTATDTDGTVSSVTWACSTCTPTSGTATLILPNWSVTSIGLAMGSNPIIVTATDNNSQTATDQIILARVAPSPANILLMAMDENTGTSVTDTSGNSNTGTFTGTGLSWATAGQYGAGINFTGTGYVSVADSASLDVAGQFSAMAWVRPNNNTGWQSIFYKSTSVTDGYAIGLYASVGSVCTAGRALAVVTTSVGQFVACSTAALSTSAFTHVAATYDGANLVLYINGSADATTPASGTISAGSGTLRIGSSIYDEYFQGTMDEVQVRGVALSAGEVTTAMNTRITGAPSPAAPVGIRLSSAAGLKCSAAACLKIGVTETQVSPRYFLLENGDHLLLETGDDLLLE